MLSIQINDLIFTEIYHFYLKEWYEDIAGEVERWSDTSNYDENDKRPLRISKNKKEICFFKDELGGKIMTESVGLRAKTWAYLIDDAIKKKKAKGTKKCVMKRMLLIQNYRDCLFNENITLQLQQRSS